MDTNIDMLYVAAPFAFVVILVVGVIAFQILRLRRLSGHEKPRRQDS